MVVVASRPGEGGDGSLRALALRVGTEDRSRTAPESPVSGSLAGGEPLGRLGIGEECTGRFPRVGINRRGGGLDARAMRLQSAPGLLRFAKGEPGLHQRREL